MMGNTSLIQTALLVALIVAFGFVATGRAPAGEPPRYHAVGASRGDSDSVPFTLGVGKSRVLNLPRDIKDVLVADPRIANIVLRSSRRVYMIGSKVGQTSIVFFDSSDRKIVEFDVAVTRDLGGIREALKRALPLATIHVEGIGEEGVLLTGVVANALEAQLATEVAEGQLLSRNANTGSSTGASNTNSSPQPSGGNSTTTNSTTTSTSGSNSKGKVINNLTIGGRDQVMLKVTVAEVQRDIIKQLGVDLTSATGGLGFGSAVLDFRNFNPFPVYGQPLVAANAITSTWKSINTTLKAMERAGVVRTLAEPNLTAISGESATFLAGGEFPIPAGYTCTAATVLGTTGNCQYSIAWKKFGVSLNFLPVVMTEGRISLKVMTEVSELSTENQLTLVQSTGFSLFGTEQNSTLTIPSIKTRRAETTVEIPSGGSLAMAGMIGEQTKQQINGIPGLMQLPVLGALFKSRDYINKQTELMVIVSPYIVRAVAQKELSRPDDGYADASDPAGVLLGKFNRIYGTPGKGAAAVSYQGQYGFILD